MNALNKFLNLNERDGRLLGIGMVIGSVFSTTMYLQIMNMCKYINWMSNMMISTQRSKLISGKNNFYFETDVNSKTVEKFKSFMDEVEPNSAINLYFETDGGLFSVAQMICNIILNHKGETNAIILNKSFSAGTLCALCCKNIYMHFNAHLSPVDVIQCNFFSSTQLSSIQNIVKNKNADKIDDSTYILDDQAKKSKTILNKIFNKICSTHNFDDKTKTTVFEEIFKGEKYTHNTVFSYDDLSSFGIKIKPITKEQEQMAKLLYKQEERQIFM